MLEMPQFGVSSSAVRERAAAGRPLRYLVPEPVARFIEEKGIYAMSATRSRRRWRGAWPSSPTRKKPRTSSSSTCASLVAYTDFLVICTARNERQARAIVDEVRVRVKRETGLLPGRRRRRRRGRLGRPRLPRLRPPRLHRRRRASATSSRISGARRRGWSSTSTRPKRPPPPAPEPRPTADAPDELPSEGAPVRCRAWEASSGLCSATAAPKWTRRCPRATAGSGPRARGRCRAQQPGRAIAELEARDCPRSRGW